MRQKLLMLASFAGAVAVVAGVALATGTGTGTGGQWDVAYLDDCATQVVVQSGVSEHGNGSLKYFTTFTSEECAAGRSKTGAARLSSRGSGGISGLGIGDNGAIAMTGSNSTQDPAVGYDNSGNAVSGTPAGVGRGKITLDDSSGVPAHACQAFFDVMISSTGNNAPVFETGNGSNDSTCPAAGCVCDCLANGTGCGLSRWPTRGRTAGSAAQAEANIAYWVRNTQTSSNTSANAACINSPSPNQLITAAIGACQSAPSWVGKSFNNWTYNSGVPPWQAYTPSCGFLTSGTACPSVPSDTNHSCSASGTNYTGFCGADADCGASPDGVNHGCDTTAHLCNKNS